MFGYIAIDETGSEFFVRKLDGNLLFAENFVLTMERHYDIRRAAANYDDNFDDASRRLQLFISRNNYIQVEEITRLMNHLQQMSLSNINAAIERAENSAVVIRTLMEVLKNHKKLKDPEMKVCIT